MYCKYPEPSVYTTRSNIRDCISKVMWHPQCIPNSKNQSISTIKLPTFPTIYHVDPLADHKVSLLPIHTRTNHWGRLWPPAITRLTAHFTCGLVSDLVMCKQRYDNGYAKCRMSLLRKVKQHKLKLKVWTAGRRWFHMYSGHLMRWYLHC